MTQCYYNHYTSFWQQFQWNKNEGDPFEQSKATGVSAFWREPVDGYSGSLFRRQLLTFAENLNRLRSWSYSMLTHKNHRQWVRGRRNHAATLSAVNFLLDNTISITNCTWSLHLPITVPAYSALESAHEAKFENANEIKVIEPVI